MFQKLWKFVGSKQSYIYSSNNTIIIINEKISVAFSPKNCKDT